MSDAIAAIRETVETFSPGGDPAALICIAKRESAFNPDAIGDKTIAAEVYDKQRSNLIAMGNPWAYDKTRWSGSFGLFQLMAPYFARLWDPVADPYDLFDPRIATVVAGRLWNRAIRLGATNPVEVRLVWAFGTKGLQYGPGSTDYDRRLATEKKRFELLGYPSSYATRDAASFGYQGFGTTPDPSQWWKLGLEPAGDDDDPTEYQRPSLAFPVMLIGAGIGLMIWANKKK